MFGCVEHVEQRGEVMREVGAIFCGVLLQIVLELAFLENPCVFGKQAKQQAHEVDFERVTGVADVFERVVQLAHALGGFDVDRVLRRDDLRGVAGDEAEVFDFFVQVFEAEFERGAVF